MLELRTSGSQGHITCIGRTTVRLMHSALKRTSSASIPDSSSKGRRQPMFRAYTCTLLALACTSLAVNAQSVSTQSTPRGSAAPPPSNAVAESLRASAATSQNAPASAPGAAPISAPNNYQLSANDQIAVEVFGEDDLRTTARLNTDGNVSLPLLGSLPLARLTLGHANS